jgi:hypothetical protein
MEEERERERERKEGRKEGIKYLPSFCSSSHV